MPFTVCWFGRLDPRPKLAPVVRQAGALLSTTGKASPTGVLLRYGAERPDPLPTPPAEQLGDFFIDHLDEKFSFYRLELSARGAYCAIWMDFSDPGQEPDENIGISLSLTLLTHQGKELVRQAVKETKPGAEAAVTDLFNKIRREVSLAAA